MQCTACFELFCSIVGIYQICCLVYKLGFLKRNLKLNAPLDSNIMDTV